MFQGCEKGLKGKTRCCENWRVGSDHKKIAIREISEFVICTYTGREYFYVSIKSVTNTIITMTIYHTEIYLDIIKKPYKHKWKLYSPRNGSSRPTEYPPPPPLMGIVPSTCAKKLELLDISGKESNKKWACWDSYARYKVRKQTWKVTDLLYADLKRPKRDVYPQTGPIHNARHSYRVITNKAVIHGRSGYQHWNQEGAHGRTTLSQQINKIRQGQQWPEKNR